MVSPRNHGPPENPEVTRQRDERARTGSASTTEDASRFSIHPRAPTAPSETPPVERPRPAAAPPYLHFYVQLWSGPYYVQQDRWGFPLPQVQRRWRAICSWENASHGAIPIESFCVVFPEPLSEPRTDVWHQGNWQPVMAPPPPPPPPPPPGRNEELF